MSGRRYDQVPAIVIAGGWALRYGPVVFDDQLDGPSLSPSELQARITSAVNEGAEVVATIFRGDVHVWQGRAPLAHWLFRRRPFNRAPDRRVAVFVGRAERQVLASPKRKAARVITLKRHLSGTIAPPAPPPNALVAAPERQSATGPS